MKIPVYQTGRVGGSTTLPGVSRTARKNPGAMAQAELNKAAPLLTAFEAATSIMVQRQKMATEIQYNESLLSAEESIRELTLSSLKDPDITNVLEGENKWSQQVQETKQTLLESINNRGARAKFNSAFDGLELQYRFKLRGDLDSKLLARAEASLTALKKNTVRDLSDPFNATIQDYDEKTGKIKLSHNAGVESGQYNPEAVTASDSQMALDISTNAVQAFIGSDVSKARELIYFYEDYKKLKQNIGITAKDVREQIPKYVGAEYTAYTLTQLDNTAVGDKLLFDALKVALDREDDLNKLNEEAEAIDAENITKAYRAMFSLPTDQSYSRDFFTTTFGMYFTPEQENELFAAGNVSAAKAKDIIYNFYTSNFQWTKDQITNAEKEIGSVTTSFASQRNDEIYETTKALIMRGNYNALNLIDLKKDLTAKDYGELERLLVSTANDILKTFILDAKRELDYNEFAQMDNTQSQVISAEFSAIAEALSEAVRVREYLPKPGTDTIIPMTYTEINDLQRELLDKGNQNLILKMKPDFETLLGAIDINEVNYIGVDLREIMATKNIANPILAVDAWLKENNTPDNISKAIATKDALRAYQKYIDLAYTGN